MDLGKSIENNVASNISKFAYFIMPNSLNYIHRDIKINAHLIYDGLWF
jgi:hypothetical protein